MKSRSSEAVQVLFPALLKLGEFAGLPGPNYKVLQASKAREKEEKQEKETWRRKKHKLTGIFHELIDWDWSEEEWHHTLSTLLSKGTCRSLKPFSQGLHSGKLRLSFPLVWGQTSQHFPFAKDLQKTVTGEFKSEIKSCNQFFTIPVVQLEAGTGGYPI